MSKTQPTAIPLWKNKIVIGGIAIVVIVAIVVSIQYIKPNPYKGVPKQSIAFLNQGDEAMEKRDIEKALDFYLKALELDDSFSDAAAKAAEAYVKAGLKHKSSNNMKMKEAMFNQANTYIDKAFNSNPNNGYAHYVKGLMADEQNNTDDAISEMEMAEKAGVSTFELHSLLGFLYNSKEEAGKSVAQFQKALQYKSDDIKTLYNLGELYFALGNYSKAVNYYGELLKYDNKDKASRVNYAAALWKNGDEEKAKEVLNSIINDTQGKKITNYNLVAWALIDKDIDYDWGITLAKAADELAPNNIESTDILGWGYFKKKNYEAAVKYLTKSMRTMPSDEVKLRLDMAKEKLEESKKSGS
ncbi:tetratricopeptide repeat protein [bacterium]|nr:tetratricopeptide repeat protein [bacterium]